MCTPAQREREEERAKKTERERERGEWIKRQRIKGKLKPKQAKRLKPRILTGFLTNESVIGFWIGWSFTVHLSLVSYC